ncbi:MAG: hypothetical protein U7126_14980 [Microcoleus sp.]
MSEYPSVRVSEWGSVRGGELEKSCCWLLAAGCLLLAACCWLLPITSLALSNYQSLIPINNSIIN